MAEYNEADRIASQPGNPSVGDMLTRPICVLHALMTVRLDAE